MPSPPGFCCRAARQAGLRERSLKMVTPATHTSYARAPDPYFDLGQGEDSIYRGTTRFHNPDAQPDAGPDGPPYRSSGHASAHRDVTRS